MTDIYDDNVTGTYFVNTDCIACDTCSDIAANCFKLTDDYDHAFVYQQPQSPTDHLLCKEAQEACPVAAIGPFNHDN